MIVITLCRSLLVAGLATLFVGTGFAQSESIHMKQLDIWTVVNYLPTRLPFAKESVEKSLNVVLIAKATGNDVFTFFEGGPVPLADSRRLEKIDLRIRREQPHPGFLMLSVAGSCIPREEVLDRYKGLSITSVPRGRSPDEQTYWSREDAWGWIRFGFAERNPDCLSSVVFDPKMS